MRQLLGYNAAAVTLAVAAGSLVSPFLGPEQTSGLWVGVAAALMVQLALFALMVRVRTRPNRFLAVWAGGTLVRMAAIGLAAAVLATTPGIAVVPSLVAMASLFFALALLEAPFFRRLRQTEV